MHQKCENCKFAHHINLNAIWTDDMQKALDEERELNEKEFSKQKWWSYSSPSSNFMYRQYITYLENKNREDNNIRCQWGPDFIEHKKTDVCGQWSS